MADGSKRMIDIELRLENGTLWKLIPVVEEAILDAGVIECESQFFMYQHQITRRERRPCFVRTKMIHITNT